MLLTNPNSSTLPTHSLTINAVPSLICLPYCVFSSVSTVTGLWAGYPWNHDQFLAWRFFSPLQNIRLALGPTQPLFSGYCGYFFRR